jgi:protein-S-isoprenylcysteine O-methyltransferase Ste14
VTFLHRYLFATMWGIWALYWWVASANVKHAIRRESLASRIMHIAPLAIAALLLLGRPGILFPLLDLRLLPRAEYVFWTGAGLAAAGLLFTVWARLHLGGNWSGIVTIKERHELVASGPYRFVRHPIYAGLLLAFAGSAVALGDLRGVLAVAIAFAALWRKLQIEERWLSEEFGDAYAAYRRRVAALVPFIL